MSDVQILNILLEYDELFEKFSIFGDGIRAILMGILKLLRNICNVLDVVYDKAYDAINFMGYEPIQELLQSVKPFILLALVASFLIISYLYIFDKKDRPDWIKNIFFLAICVTTLPVVTSKLNENLILSKDILLDWQNVDDNITIADSLIISNSYDLLYMANRQFYTTGNTNDKNNIRDINAINVEEVISEDDSEIFHYYVLYAPDGNAYLNEIRKSWSPISVTPYYYRWHIDFLPLIIQMIGMIIAYLVLSYKTIALNWELFTGQLLVNIIGGDITGGARLRRIIEYMRNTYIVLFLLTIFLKIYQLVVNYINSFDWPSLVKALISLFFALALAGGADIVKQVLGIDPGVSNGLALLYAGAEALKVAGGAAKAAVNTVGGIGGFAAGALDEMHSGDGDGDDGSDDNGDDGSDNSSGGSNDTWDDDEDLDDNNGPDNTWNDSSGNSSSGGFDDDRDDDTDSDNGNGWDEGTENSMDDAENGQMSEADSKDAEVNGTSHENEEDAGKYNDSSEADREDTGDKNDDSIESAGQDNGESEVETDSGSERGVESVDDSGDGHEQNIESSNDGAIETDGQGDAASDSGGQDYGEKNSENSPIQDDEKKRMSDLKNERRAIIQEHKERMRDANMSNSSTVRSTKKGFERGRTAVRLAKNRFKHSKHDASD